MLHDLIHGGRDFSDLLAAISRLLSLVLILVLGLAAGLLLGRNLFPAGPGSPSLTAELETTATQAPESGLERMLPAAELLIRNEVTRIWDSGLLDTSMLGLLANGPTPPNPEHAAPPQAGLLEPFAHLPSWAMDRFHELITLPGLASTDQQTASVLDSLGLAMGEISELPHPGLWLERLPDPQAVNAVRNLAMCLLANAVYLQQQDRTEQAVFWCVRTLGLASSLSGAARSEQELLMAADILYLSSPVVAFVLSRKPADSAPDEISTALAGRPLLTAYAALLALRTTATLEALPPSLATMAATASTDHEEELRLRLDMATSLRYLRLQLEACALPESMALPTLMGLDSELEGFDSTSFARSASLYRNAGLRLTRASAALDMMELAVALARHRQVVGWLPMSLDDLVPEFLDRQPLDPELGLPYVYDLNAPGFGLERPVLQEQDFQEFIPDMAFGTVPGSLSRRLQHGGATRIG